MCIVRHVNLYHILPPFFVLLPTHVRPSRVQKRGLPHAHIIVKGATISFRKTPLQILCAVHPQQSCVHINLTPRITTTYRSPNQNGFIVNPKMHRQPFFLQYPKNTLRGPPRALTPLSELHGQTLSPNLNCTTSSKPS